MAARSEAEGAAGGRQEARKVRAPTAEAAKMAVVAGTVAVTVEAGM